jgi:hypothetical protein
MVAAREVVGLSVQKLPRITTNSTVHRPLVIQGVRVLLFAVLR